MNAILLNANALHIPIADESVQCVITSPPYFGLRDYQTGKWEGGSVECDHISGTENPRSERPLGKFHGGDDRFSLTPFKDVCGKCGAIRVDHQIGLERTPAEYVDSLVRVFREVWRVLKDDGVLWLNLGDSYATRLQGDGWEDFEWKTGGAVAPIEGTVSTIKRTRADVGAKPKDLLMIPARVALALQADGWYLRSDIIWHKPNPMPESVTDRPTKAHEYIFLLSKSATYYYDAEAIAEEGIVPAGTRRTIGKAKDGSINRAEAAGRTASGNEALGFAYVSGTRNKRTVWTVATQPYSEAHFATFPQKLVEPMILAGSAKGDLVLDPFAGTATVGRVAIKHQRRFVGLELNPAYIALAQDRTSNVQVAML